jgi:hypothetical protein
MAGLVQQEAGPKGHRRVTCVSAGGARGKRVTENTFLAPALTITGVTQ